MKEYRKDIYAKRRKGGFTLLELLTVVVIIGFLVTLTGTAAVKIRKMARQKKRDVQKSSLECVAVSYRHEYGVWPANINASVGTNQVVNHQVFLNHLRSTLDLTDQSRNDLNKKDIHFIRASDYEIDDSNNTKKIIDPVNRKQFRMLVNLSNDKFWCENGQ